MGLFIVFIFNLYTQFKKHMHKLYLQNNFKLFSFRKDLRIKFSSSNLSKSFD